MINEKIKKAKNDKQCCIEETYDQMVTVQDIEFLACASIICYLFWSRMLYTGWQNNWSF